jgi:DNA-binding Xre family transcriptional regulator
MAIHWHLKTYLARQQGIYRPTDLQALVVKKTNILISLPSISKLLNRKPAAIRLHTMELICTALDCQLSDFCQIKPSVNKRPEVRKRLSPVHTPANKKSVTAFPDPVDYE